MLKVGAPYHVKVGARTMLKVGAPYHVKGGRSVPC